MNSGIYKITNLINNKLYIGQSRNVKTRILRHKYLLKNNSHVNQHLQNAYNKYGVNSFKYDVLEYCDESILNERECYWISHFKSCDRLYGYNSMLPSPNEKTFYHSNETKQKLRESKSMYSKEELISYLQDYYYHFGKIPTTRDLAKSINIPSPKIYIKKFGSYKHALIEADLYDFIIDKSFFNKKDYTKDEILEMFRIFIDKNGRFPTNDELNKSRNHNLPTAWAIDKYFNSRNEIKELLNYIDEDKIKEKELALEGLLKLYKQNGKINSTMIEKSPLTRSTKYYQLNFESINNAYKLVGIPLTRNT